MEKMVEAIISVPSALASSSKTTSRSEATVVSTEAVQKASQKNFVSSSIRVDNLQNVAILEYRSEAGEVVQQYPSQSQIEAFKNAERIQTETRHAEATHQQAAHEASPPAEHHAAVKTPAAPAPHETHAAPAPPSGGGIKGEHSVIA